MYRVLITTIITSMTLLVYSSHGNLTQERTELLKADKVEGVYEFVSEVTELTKPEKATIKRTSSEWAGRWQFQGGYFNQTLMKKGERAAICNSQKEDSIGYETLGGTYTVRGNKIEFIWEFAISPLVVGRSMAMEYKLDKDSLTLIQTIHEDVHSINAGTRTTILHRIR